MLKLALLAAGCWLLTQAARIVADDRHYLLMFASQGNPPLPAESHTFAVFAKATKDERGTFSLVESHCISWLPRSLEIEVLELNSVTGKNLSLAETLKWARKTDARVTMWGPYQVKKDLYDMAVQQVERLNANAIEYVVLDGRRRGRKASNCIHAVSDLDTTRRQLATGTAYGDLASQMVLRHFEPYLIESTEPTRWLCDQLQLKADEIRFVTAEANAETAATKSDINRVPKQP